MWKLCMFDYGQVNCYELADMGRRIVLCVLKFLSLSSSSPTRHPLSQSSAVVPVGNFSVVPYNVLAKIAASFDHLNLRTASLI
ncbi:hypothetical protein RJT34_02057 [Clitoria ternatea]|uniref:Uncharacterized protein n=1 Tax=Clitoria ternatea TaxID=43366 RepID=A0AAN9Q059_CLITE